jgi:hypothetical protein
MGNLKAVIGMTVEQEAYFEIVFLVVRQLFAALDHFFSQLAYF